MDIPLKCPVCKESASYDIEKISGKTIIYRGMDLPPDFPDTVVVPCRNCPTKFKIAKRDIEKAIIDYNLPGETRGG